MSKSKLRKYLMVLMLHKVCSGVFSFSCSSKLFFKWFSLLLITTQKKFLNSFAIFFAKASYFSLLHMLSQKFTKTQWVALSENAQKP